VRERPENKALFVKRQKRERERMTGIERNATRRKREKRNREEEREGCKKY
jgi:hypothetical protein